MADIAIPDIVVFAPSPSLTITIEERDEEPDIHIHAGGQGVWQARMLRRLGTTVTMCCTFAGETGGVLRHLLDGEGFDVVAVERDGQSAAYIHDRRGGQRRSIVETAGSDLSRHVLDELYGQTLRVGMDAQLVLLSGPAGDVLPAEVYRRLAADLRSCDCCVMVDLAGPRLDAALAGHVDIVKISHEELLADGRITSIGEAEIIAAMRTIRDAGADTVIVTRAEKPLLMLTESDTILIVTNPIMEVVDTSGAGDSFTAATAAEVARGAEITEAVVLGAAAGALNVTRHGHGTGDRAAIHRLSRLVHVVPYGEDHEDHHPPRIGLRELAEMFESE
ncbi:PfkB family carbohydrate kinase [Agromyces bauzanensis]|uniref:1-phosphofructokinase n=1 Tax=Agromyces bauzanensis TaxID=1308924 RepID=A0A917PNB9_9MICO|nr:1-phosphofructokinase [Agromyces bauzanensis]